MIKHKMESPFPKLLNGLEVVDEKCYCGKFRSDHEDSSVAWGHGGTPDGKCLKFEWQCWVHRRSS